MNFEFGIDGPPVSAQTRNRNRLDQWRKRVTAAAYAKWPPGVPPTPHEVQVRITYFHDGDAPDVDNIIKPIQDALVGLVYVDDSQVCDTHSRRRNLEQPFLVRGVSEELAARLARGRDFLWIEVLPPPAKEPLR